ncbi:MULTISPECIES: hypothetical protein [unclassified Pantoea]|uniref:hypothetical protein n=1 Tax=unclassified Pantoea TaxID=2630326 RepID=UPI0023DB06DA|nr:MULTISPECIES: hypothetical protein [unclassified Pantoea]MDF2041214.1 hypothetical protein [Pantoea sp. Cr_R14]MDF2069901.1 hypothetical protein [Pantoea sp. Cr_R13]MDF2078531.1 hypothetical protein [Pantoea sp. Cr_R21]
MKSVILRFMMSTLLLAGCASANAATMDITASFSPSMENPENNTFTNTTKQSGYCSTAPSECKENNVFSISMGEITASLATSGITANSTPRMGMYYKMPGAWRNVTATNKDTGEQVTISFRTSAFSAQYNTKSDWTITKHKEWNGDSFVNAPSPCSYSGVGKYGNRFYMFMWKWPLSDAACYKTATKDLTGEPYLINNTSLGYELKTPDPLKMESGVYTGRLALRVGPGGDIDFGDNFQASDSELDINFTLTVNHELKLTTTPENRAVSLQPCATGRFCSEEEGSANWERWMVNRITPELTGKSNFNLSSSGGFTVYLQCEQQSGSDCALKSDNTPSQTVPVRTLLTLPENIIDNSTGSTVSKRRLTAGKDLTKNVFTTKSFGENRAGSIEFLVGQKDVDTMLKTRPDTYRGAVTVIFDPDIY